MWPFTRKTRRAATGDTTILARISTLLRANIHAALNQAEDPEKMLDQLVRDFTAAIGDARAAVQQTIANVRLIESQQNDDIAAVATWGDKAALAAARLQSQRAKGDEAGAARTEKLARVALQKQIAAEKRFDERAPRIEQQNVVIENLKDGLAAMKEKLEDLKERRSELLSRYSLAEAQESIVDAVGQIDTSTSTSTLSQLEDKVARKEALAGGKLELAQSSIENQFDELENLARDDEAQTRLDALLQIPRRKGLTQ